MKTELPEWERRLLEEKESPRAQVLDEAKQLITGDRNNQYGHPLADHGRVAGVLNALGYRREDGNEIKAHDVAIIIIALKMSRLMWNPTKKDSWADIAGYAGCGYETATSFDT